NVAANMPNQFGNAASQAVIPPDALSRIQQDFLKEWSEIVTSAHTGKLPVFSDRRFSAPAWAQSPLHHLVAHSYLLSSRALMRMAEAVQGDEALRQRVRFAVLQWIDAMSPANFLALNPDAQQEMLKSGGQSLQSGFANLVADMVKG